LPLKFVEAGEFYERVVVAVFVHALLDECVGSAVNCGSDGLLFFG